MARTNAALSPADIARYYPAAPPLATPTDLEPRHVSAVVEAINPLIADAFALYVKTKNFHWHVSGPQFRDDHLLFDEQAEDIFAAIDVLAERVRKIGGTTLRSIGAIAALQTIVDDDEAYVTPRDMLLRLLADNQHIAEMQRRAIAVCDEQQDTPTGNILQELLDHTERRIWFLFETSRRDEAFRSER